MGSRISTVEDSNAYAPTPPPPYSATSHHAPNYHHHHHHHNFIDVEEIKGPDSFNPKTKYHSTAKSKANNNRSKSPAAAALLPSSNVAKLHRPINFHSSQSCRGYLEASKVSNSLIVIDFTNRWCARCRSMEPTLHEFASRYTNVDFLKIDVDELYDISNEYGVQTTPTYLFMRKGKLIDKVAGANKQELQNKIEKHRN